MTAIGGSCGCGAKVAVFLTDEEIQLGDLLPPEAWDKLNKSWFCPACGESLVGVAIDTVPDGSPQAVPFS